MKQRQRRNMRTRPRPFTIAFSMQCEPYEIDVEGMKFTMNSKRVNRRFTMQHMTRGDMLRKLKQFITEERPA